MLDSVTGPRRGAGRLRALSVGAVVVATTAAVVGLVFANLAGAAKVVPELIPGTANKTCGELDGPGQDWLELKVDPNADGTYTQGPLTVTISNTQNDKTFDWTSNIGVDAVFVKAGVVGSYIYRYDPPQEETSDTGLTSPGSSGNGISHIAFCYDVEKPPKPPPGVINVIKTANPTSVKEPGGPVNFTVTVENTGPVNVTINSVVDDKFGNLANVAGGSPSGCFAVPFVLTPGQSSTCTFPKTVSGAAGTSHVNVVTASGVDTSQNPVSDSDDATVTFTERLIDLVIVKDATSPTPLNGIVTYTMTVTNKGPDTATNVQLVDPAPAGITYLTVNPGSPTCTLTPALITCSLGTLDPNQSKSVTVTARATTIGTKTNTATVTGSGGRETNPADNVDTAVTVVPQALQPPTAKPKPKPKPKQQVCLTLTVTPKMVTADGRPDTVKVKTTAGPKRVKGTMVRIKGAGVKKSARSNARGIATLRINPKRPGVLTITAVETKNQQVCGPRRIGAVGVFLPPLTG